MQLSRMAVQPIIDRALREDIGSGDVTTLLTVPAEAEATAEIVAKKRGVISGLPVAGWIFQTLDPQVECESLVEEGSAVAPLQTDEGLRGVLVARLRGKARALLTGERAALNFLQRMSGIATITSRFVALAEKAASNAGVKPPRILDTRKTTPGMRRLEKYSVRVGGGCNHRSGLYDAVLIKDNHIVAAGGIGEALTRARGRVSSMMKIEIEVKDLNELDEALATGADVIMLDNMSVEEIRQAATRVAGRTKLEVSGGVNEGTIAELATTGVDYISVGALTHSAPSVDISMNLRMVDG